MTLRMFRAYAWFVLAAALGVVVFGAYVRATGSGAGCGNHWPSCDGAVVPRPKTVEMLIEFVHRTSSGLLTLLVAAEIVLSRRAFARGHAVRRAAAFSGVFLVVEALVGALLVKLELVVDNATPARAVIMGVHLVNTFLLLGALALVAHHAGGRLSRDDRAPSRPARGTGAATRWGLLAAVGVVLGTGVTGAIAALGDTLFPSASLAAGIAADLAPTAHALIRLRAWHPIVAIAGAAYLMVVPSLTSGAKRSAARGYGTAVRAAVGLQLLLGVGNLLLLAPVWMQLVHLLAADLVWITLVLFAASARVELA